MRKHTMALGVALALSLGGAGLAAAQSATPTERPHDRAGQHQRGPGRRGGPDRGLLKGITLSSAQQARLQDMRKSDRDAMQKDRDAMRSTFEKIRSARQSGDTATARSLMSQMRARMQSQHEQRVASIRAILTPDQQRQFDANVAAWKQHANDRPARGGRGGEHRAPGAGQGQGGWHRTQG